LRDFYTSHRTLAYVVFSAVDVGPILYDLIDLYASLDDGVHINVVGLGHRLQAKFNIALIDSTHILLNLIVMIDLSST